MNESHETFREQLLGAEQLTPAYREKYEKEVRAMWEEKIGGRNKWYNVFFLLLGIFFLVVFGSAAVLAPREFPIFGRIAFIAGAVFGLAWAVLMGIILRKGIFNLRTHPRAMAGLTWCFLVIMLTLFLLSGIEISDPIKHIHLLVGGLVYLGMGTFMLLSARIHHSELKTREKLLEIEYRLAEIAEKMRGENKK